MAQSSLERAGHTVMCAASAHEVADLIATRDAPVVLLSAGLPEHEAQEALAQALGARGEAPPIVIIGAGDDQRAQAQTLLAKGATGTVPRPYDRERLAAQLLLFAVGSMPAVVLVVDDSKVEREHSVNVLHEAGHRTFAARCPISRQPIVFTQMPEASTVRQLVPPQKQSAVGMHVSP